MQKINITDVTGLTSTLVVATISTDGFLSAADKTKLDGIATGATANSSNATLLARANHTGEQAISTVTGLQTALDGKQAAGSYAISSHVHSAATTSVDGFLSAADKTKLNGIATGATANSSDATLLARVNHTGVQAISTVTGLQAALDSKLSGSSPTFTGSGIFTSTDATPLTVERTGSSSNLNIELKHTGATRYFGLNATGALSFGTSADLSSTGSVIWHAGNDGTGSGLDADLLDGVQGSGYVNTTATQSISGAKTFVNAAAFNDISYHARPLQTATGVPIANLGNPTITEMALFEGQFDNKLWFYPTASFLFEYTNNGVDWIEQGNSDINVKRLVAGAGATSKSSIVIPYGVLKYRITIRNKNTYVYLNAMYAYMSTSGNVTEITIAKKRDDGSWINQTSSTATVNSWPGHIYLPFNTIPWSLSVASPSHYQDVRIEFTPNWVHASNPISLYSLEMWGGYPAGKRTIYSFDEDQHVTFPANITNSGEFYNTSSSGTGVKTRFILGAASGSTSDGPLYIQYGKTQDVFVGSTGNSSLFVSGNVGIGKTSTSVKLDVVNDTNAMVARFANNVPSASLMLSIERQSSGVATGATRFGFSSNESQIASMAGFKFHVGNTADLNSVANGTEAFTIGSTGNVGIGETNPSKSLVVAGQGVGRMLVGSVSFGEGYTALSMNGSLSSTSYNLLASTSQTSLWINRSSGGDICFREGHSSDQVIIKAGGNVGIGTTSPTTKLSVVSPAGLPSASAQAEATILVVDSVGGATRLGLGTHSTGTWIQSSQPGIAGAAYPLTINPSGGNVGIGTTSPGAALHVGPGSASTVGSHAPQIYNAQTSGIAAVGVGVTDGTNNRRASFFVDQTNALWGLQLAYSTGNIPFAIITGANERLRIDTSGNVGIGNTSPASKLHVVGSGIVVNTTGGAATSIGRHINLGNVTTPTDWRPYSGSTTAAIQMETSETEGFILVATLGAAVPRTQLITTGGFQINVGATIGGAGTNALQILSGGNVGIGTTSPTAKLTIQGSSEDGADPTYGGYLKVIGPGGAAASIGGIEFKSANSGAGYGWRIAAPDLGNGETPLYFQRRSSSATWTDSVTILGTNGNVGIGTTTPATKLDIVGSNASQLRISNTTADTTIKNGYVQGRHYTNAEEDFLGVLMTSGSSANDISFGGGSTILNAATGIHFYTAGTNTTLTGSERMTINSSGNVGIGTTNPGAKLHVFGTDTLPVWVDTTAASSMIRFLSDSSTSRGRFGYDSTGAIFQDASGGTTHMRIDNATGNVSIAQGNAPTQALTLYRAGSTATYLATGNSNTGLDGSWFGTGATGDTEVRAGTGVAGKGVGIWTDGVRRLSVISGGNVGIGTTNPSDPFEVQSSGNDEGIRLRSSNGSSNLAWLHQQNTDAVILRMYDGGTENVRIHSEAGGVSYFNAGNVGIGTTAPGEKLQVNGTLAVAASDAGFAAGYFAKLTSGHSTQPLLLSSRLGAILSADNYGADTTLYANNSAAMTIKSGGNVGIGTTSPTAGTKLDVVGALKVGTGVSAPSGQLLISSTSGTSATLQLFQDSVESWTVSNPASSTRLAFSASGNERMTILTGGNVGIGTTTPNGNLEVAANVSAYPTTGVYGQLELTGGVSNTTRRLSLGYNINSGAGFIQAVTNGSSFDNLILNPSGGNVGIGTQSPSHRLVVSGPNNNPILDSTAVADASMMISNSDTDYGTYFASLGNGKGIIQQRRQTSAVYYDLAINPYGGNVGIGTSSPAAKLDVAGTILSSGGNFDTTNGGDRSIILRSSTSYNYKLQTTGNHFQILEAGDPTKVRFGINYPDGNVYFQSPNVYANGQIMWHAGNDGASSGLDADLLDGQHGSFYQSASNLNAGTVPDARLSGTYTGVSITGNAATATTLATGRTLAITGDLTWTSPSFNGSGNVTAAGTLATVNSNVGQYGTATQAPQITVNAKGLVTALGVVTITPAWSSITSTPTTLAGYGITDAAGIANAVPHQDGTRSNLNFNTTLTSGFYNTDGAPTNGPGGNYGQLIVARGIDTGLQIAGGYTSDLYFRGWSSSGAVLYPWRKLWHDGNDGAGSGLDADLLDGQHGSFYQSASNLNAGTVPDARITGAYTGITSLHMSGALTVAGTLGNWSVDSQGAIMDFTRGSANYIRASNAAGSLYFQAGGANTHLIIASGGGSTFYGHVAAPTFSGSGASLTALNATQLTTGTVPDARITGAYTGITTLSISDTLTSTKSGPGDNIYLNGTTSNWIGWAGTGSAAPAFTTRSAGTKLVLYPGIGASSADYAIGIESSTLWNSVPTTGNQFKWYGGTTLAATLTGAGALTLTGGLTASTLSGSGASITALNASNLSSGTVASARIAGAYSGITALGTQTSNMLFLKSNPWLTLQGSGASEAIDQGSGISIGESGYKGSAAIHITYTGDGYGHIGMGVVSGSTNLPAYEAMRLCYTDNIVRFYANPTVNGNTIWHAGNDGASSGLDADLLDGQHGSFYQSASNLNAGTVPDARITGAYSGITNLTMSGTLTALNVSGAGSGLTSLNASNLSSGTVPDARLSGIYSGIGIKLTGTNTIFGEPNTGTQSATARTVTDLVSYRNSGSAATGAIVFIAPNTLASIMHRLKIEGMIYTGGPTVCAIVQGYKTTTWGQTSKVNLGLIDIQVRFGQTSDGKSCVILGDVGTTWSYVHIAITHAMFSHGSVADSYCYGWTSALVTDLSSYTNVTSTINNTWGFGGSDLYVGGSKVWDESNDGAGSGLDADLLDGSQRDTAYNSFGNNTIPVRHPTGYIYSNYFNMTANTSSGTATKIAIENSGDGFLRWQHPSQFITNHSISTVGHTHAATDITSGTIADARLSGTYTGVNISGNAGTATTLATGRTIAMTGDVTWTSASFNGSGNVTGTATLATVNSNVGTFGSGIVVPNITVNAKGLVTAVTTTTLGTAASATIGTIGGAVPLLNTQNTWSKGQILSSDTVSDSWTSFGFQIREVNLVAAAQSSNAYAPSIAFHWSGRNVKRLLMDSAATLKWDADAIWHANGLPTGAWQKSTDTKNRFYFSYNSTTLFSSPDNYSWRNYLDADIMGLTSGGTLTAAGDITAYSSDERLKENVRSIENPLDKIDQIGGYVFDWKRELVDELGFSPYQYEDEHGFLAQEIQKIMPDAVRPAPFNDKYLTVKYERLVPLAVAGIKELMIKNTALENKVADLENKLERILEMLEQKV